MNLTQGVTSVTPVGLSSTRALVLREGLCSRWGRSSPAAIFHGACARGYGPNGPELSLLGLMPERSTQDLSPTFSMLQIPFLPGDRFVLYTDGITESLGPDGSELGVDGLERYVAESADRPLGEFAEAIRHRVEQFRGGVRPDDDELLLAIAYLEAEGSPRLAGS